jgi:dolichol-phosphate mannosyltransferase
LTTDAGGSVWVCVPTFNERENVADLVRATRAVLERTVADGHVLVIDDSSPDGTGAIVEEIARTDTRVHLLQRPQKEGIGPAYRAGFRYALDAGAQRIVEMDCDFSHDPDDIPRLLEATQHSDVAIGSRYVAGGGVRNWGAIRRLISRGGCLYAQGILWVPVRDLTGGFKCFRRRVLETIPLDQVAGQGSLGAGGGRCFDGRGGLASGGRTAQGLLDDATGVSGSARSGVLVIAIGLGDGNGERLHRVVGADEAGGKQGAEQGHRGSPGGCDFCEAATVGCLIRSKNHL